MLLLIGTVNSTGLGVAPGSEFVADAQRQEPAGFELEAIDLLIGRELDEHEGACPMGKFSRDARADVSHGIAAIGEVGVDSALAAIPPEVQLQLRGKGTGVQVAQRRC